MMKKMGMMMVCGNSIEELENDLAMLKMAVATGATMGCGGSTLADVEKGVAMMGGVLPHNYPSDHLDRYCGCNCTCKAEPCYAEDEDDVPTVYEILEMVESGEITADEADELMREYYEGED